MPQGSVDIAFGTPLIDFWLTKLGEDQSRKFISHTHYTSISASKLLFLIQGCISLWGQAVNQTVRLI